MCGALDSDKKGKIQMKKSKKIIISVFAGLLVLILAICTVASNFLINYGLARSGTGANRNIKNTEKSQMSETQLLAYKTRDIEKEKAQEFLEKVKENQAQILSENGLKLNGFYFLQPKTEDFHNWVIAIHGYRSSHKENYDTARNYYEKGFNVLLPDLRTCGSSEGDYVGMGWLDRKDILKWIDWIIEKDDRSQIVIQGVSMGAATTMMVSGEQTPDNVKAFVEDCGYTSVWDIFSSELKLRFHLPDFPILYAASFFTKIRAGYTFGEGSALEQVKKCTKPMIFIHGTTDDFVPFYMQKILYDAKPGDNKLLLIAANAGHTQSKYVLGEVYWNTIFDFLSNYIEM